MPNHKKEWITMKYKKIFYVIFVTIIAAFLNLISSSNRFINQLIKMNLLPVNTEVEHVKEISLIVSIVFSLIFISIKLAKEQIKNINSIEERNLLINMTKNILKDVLMEKFSKNFSSFNIRIFTQKYPRLYAFFDFFHIKNYKKVFKIKNIPQIAETGTTKDLEFEVFPKWQGLVGLCFENRCIIYDDNLQENNDKQYNLVNNQLSKTSNLEWSICFPLFDTKDNIVSIISFDGQKKINIEEKQETELSRQIIVFSIMLHDAVPQLFRR